MQKCLRDRGWMPTKHVIHHIQSGLVLEVGPGPGYLGLEWLCQTSQTRLIGYDISDDMLAIARKNAEEYHLAERTEYKKGDVREMPFENERFDAVFSSNSMHEWTHPIDSLIEIHRVLKPGGIYFISDLRRDMMLPVKLFMWINCRPKICRPGLLSSIDASYTLHEIQKMITKTNMRNGHVE